MDTWPVIITLIPIVHRLKMLEVVLFAGVDPLYELLINLIKFLPLKSFQDTEYLEESKDLVPRVRASQLCVEVFSEV